MIFQGGSTHDPCSDNYCGSKPFSEVETAQVSKFLANNNDTIIHYINFHSYSQLWMSPWGKQTYKPNVFFLISLFVGYTTRRPEQFKLQDDGSAQAVEALTAVFGMCQINF